MNKIFAVVFGVFWLLTGCQNGGSDPGTGTLVVAVAPPPAMPARMQGKITLPAVIDSLTVIVSSETRGELVRRTITQNGVITLGGLPAGEMLTVVLEARDANDILYGSGSSTVTLQTGVSVSVNIVLSYSNTPPVAMSDTLNVIGTTATYTLSGYDYDQPAQTLTFEIVTQPTAGTVSLTNVNTGAMTYTLTDTNATSDSFTFRVFDGFEYSTTETITVTITPAQPNTIQRTSLDASSQQIAGASSNSADAVSADGRHVAFVTNMALVAADQNSTDDVYVRDTLRNETTLVSVDGNGAAMGDAGEPSISADGRHVAFVSSADASTMNLSSVVNVDTNAVNDVFVHDRLTGETFCRSVGTDMSPPYYTHTGNGVSFEPVINADGQNLAFTSGASDLSGASDTNGVNDVYVYDAGSIYLYRASVSNSSGAQLPSASYQPSVTGSGITLEIAFVTETDATQVNSSVITDTNGSGTDIFVMNGEGGVTNLVSRNNTDNSSTGNYPSLSPRFSLDGSKLVFSSRASTLSADGGGSDVFDIFSFDRQANSMSLVSGNLTSSGGGNFSSYAPVSSADGRFVAFESDAANLVAGDTNTVQDIFVRDTVTNTSVRVSLDENGLESLGASNNASISADGSKIVFNTAVALVNNDTNGLADVYATPNSLVPAVPVLLSKDSNGFIATAGANYTSAYSDITPDGRYVVFATVFALDADDTNSNSDIYRHDIQTGETVLVSRTSTGAAATGDSYMASISDDGRYVAFESSAADMTAGDTNSVADIFLRDMNGLATTTRISVQGNNVAESNGASGWPAISGNGQYLVFVSMASNLDPAITDTNNSSEIFLRDLAGGTTTCLSVAAGFSESGNGQSGVGARPSISADGALVAFASDASNLLNAGSDMNNATDIFVRDRQSNNTTRVSVVTLTGAESTYGEFSHMPVISDNGRYVTFRSAASNLAGGDTNNITDIFVHDRQASTTTRVSMDSNEIQGNGFSGGGSGVSADGRYVVFSSNATNLDAGDTAGYEDVFVRDLQNGNTARVSLNLAGQEVNGNSNYPKITADGSKIVFSSEAGDMLPWDGNTTEDLFMVNNPLYP